MSAASICGLQEREEKKILTTIQNDWQDLQFSKESGDWFGGRKNYRHS
jgi:hypothetical protein